VDFTTFEIIPARTTSGAEEIAKHLPEGAKLVKAFNTNFAGTLTKGEVDGNKLDVFIASDDKDAANTVATLVNESGMRGLYVGALSKAQTLEGIALINMTLQEKLGSNWMSAIKIVS
jgi:predicted dinucleotide-binding enzyme